MPRLKSSENGRHGPAATETAGATPPAPVPGRCQSCGGPLAGNFRCYTCLPQHRGRGVAVDPPADPRVRLVDDAGDPVRRRGPAVVPVPSPTEPGDAEVRTIAAMVATLGGLDDAARRRVLDYVLARFRPATPPVGGPVG